MEVVGDAMPPDHLCRCRLSQPSRLPLVGTTSTRSTPSRPAKDTKPDVHSTSKDFRRSRDVAEDYAACNLYCQRLPTLTASPVRISGNVMAVNLHFIALS